MKLSDYVVEFFEDYGVTDLFMVTGGGCMHLVNSFGNSSKISYWCTHHEQAAAMAAEGYSKMKNSLGLVLTTSGPGATNTITGILDCYQDSIPVVFLFGQSKTQQTCQMSGIKTLRQFGVQEANIIPIVDSITKYAVEVNDPNKIRYHLEKAVYEATSGRPGPSVISIPLDIQCADVNISELEGYDEKEEIAFATSEEIAYVVEVLKKANRPVIVGGHGIRLSNGCEVLEKLVHEHSIPVVTPFMGIDILAGNDICNIGRIGTKGTRAGNFALQNADLIISIGSRLAVSSVGHNYELFGREAKIIVVDVDYEEHLKETIDIDRIVKSDAKDFMIRLLQRLDMSFDYSEWLSVCDIWKERYPVVLPEYDDDKHGINYYKFIDIINRHSSSGMPIISDAGSAFYVVAQTVEMKSGQRHITTGGTATMGFSLPASLGVSVAIGTNKSPVIAITGEGSFMQNMQEMETAQYNNMNIKLFVMCNGGYFSIHQTQKKFFEENYVGAGVESGISFSNLAKLADAFNVKYYKIETIYESESQIDSILNDEGPALIEVKVNQNMEVIPTNSSMMKENGEMVSKPLEDMYPFLNREEFLENMIIPIVEE